MQLLQVHRFYEKYLDSFYKSRPWLKTATFDEQMKELFQDAFSGIHIIAPYLRGKLIVANCAYAQYAWLRKHGIAISTIKGLEEKEIVQLQVASIKPDILYLSSPILYNGAFIRSLPYKPKLILGWMASDVPFGIDWNGFDIMLSGLPRLLEVAKEFGVRKGVYFVPGMPEWIARAVDPIEQDTDVVFVGSISPSQHMRRLAALKYLAMAAASHGFSLALHLSCNPDIIPSVLKPFLRKPVFGLEMHKTLRRGRIVFDIQGDIGLVRADGSRCLDLAGGDTINMRLFEGTGGGSLLITEALPGLSKFFVPNQEVVTFKNIEELVNKILYYLNNPQERDLIATTGRRKCLSKWGMALRSKAFLSIVNKELSQI